MLKQNEYSLSFPVVAVVKSREKEIEKRKFPESWHKWIQIKIIVACSIYHRYIMLLLWFEWFCIAKIWHMRAKMQFHSSHLATYFSFYKSKLNVKPIGAISTHWFRRILLRFNINDFPLSVFCAVHVLIKNLPLITPCAGANVFTHQAI